MATKQSTNKSNKSKSNVSKSTQLTQFKFKWWMAAIGVGVVAILGIVIIQFSNAGGATYMPNVSSLDCVKDTLNPPYNTTECRFNLGSSGRWSLYSNYRYATRGNSNGTITCATMTSYGFKNQGLIGHIQNGQPITVTEVKTVPQDYARGIYVCS